MCENFVNSQPIDWGGPTRYTALYSLFSSANPTVERDLLSFWMFFVSLLFVIPIGTKTGRLLFIKEFYLFNAFCFIIAICNYNVSKIFVFIVLCFLLIILPLQYSVISLARAR